MQKERERKSTNKRKFKLRSRKLGYGGKMVHEGEKLACRISGGNMFPGGVGVDF
jgi:hypothetical protein